MNIQHRFARNVVARRRKLGISQRLLAIMIEVSQSHISRLEEGKSIPKIDTVEKIAKALKTTCGELLDE